MDWFVNFRDESYQVFAPRRPFKSGTAEGAPGAVKFIFDACALRKWSFKFARSCLRIPCILRRVGGVFYSGKRVFERERLY
jgi:hypothetical protein